jgi:hypothetical protein
MKYLPITLEKNIEAYNLILLGRLVQIELTPCSLQQEGVLYLTRIIRLYKECVSQVQNIKSTTLDTLRVIFQEQDKMAKKLYALSVFKDDYTKRTNFENLIQEWTKITFALIERLQYAYALRLPKLREEIEQSLFVLIQIRQLFEEKAAPFVEKLTPTPAVPQEKHFSIREEEAVRLYQEMDRMDRMLYGEK